MKFKKHLLIIPAVAVMSLGANFVFANTTTDTSQDAEVLEYQPERLGLVSKITGEVVEIEANTVDDVTTYAIVITGEDSTNNIINIGQNTVFIVDGELVDIESIEEGMEITVHYQGSGIVTGPLMLDLSEEGLTALENGEDTEINTIVNVTARYYASAIVANTEEDSFVSVHVDIFNDELVSTDFNLRLVIDEDTEIVDRNGEVYEGSLENKRLAVIYGASTKSMPAIPLNPKVIVLAEVVITEYIKDEVVQPINMLDFIPEFARGNSANQNNQSNQNNYNYEDDIVDENDMMDEDNNNS